MTSKTFTVHRESEIEQEASVDVYCAYFYAISGRTDFIERAGDSITHKYESQVAFIKCKHGWIDEVDVFEESLEPNIPGARNAENSRNCGIATVLTELCLIDPFLNRLGNLNKAERYLRNFVEQHELVTRTCEKLVGLAMTAWPVTGAQTYFSAGIRMKYEKLMIDQSKKKDEFKIYETKIARENYDTNTGIIQPCCEETEQCSALFQQWFFCAEGLTGRRAQSGWGV